MPVRRILKVLRLLLGDSGMLKTNHYTLVAGIGNGSTELNAFDNALYNAGVGNYNLSRVSSILPPLSREETVIRITAGGILPIAYGSKVEQGVETKIVAVVAAGLPKNPEDIGVIMEYSGFEDQKQAELIVKEMVYEAMHNRNIPIMDIKCISSSCLVKSNFCCAFAGIALW